MEAGCSGHLWLTFTCVCATHCERVQWNVSDVVLFYVQRNHSIPDNLGTRKCP